MGKQSSNAVDARLDKIDERLGNVEREVHGISTALKVVGAIISLLLLFAIGLVLTTGRSVVRDIARDVYREESDYRTNLQAGNLTKQNQLHDAQVRTSTHPIMVMQFHWELKQEVDPNKVIDIRVRARKLPPDVTISCEVDDDGKGCTFTLTGPQDVVESLELPVSATVVIVSAS